MNVLKKMAIFSMVGLLASCSNNDDNDNDNNLPASIIGDWKVVSLMSDGVEYVESGDCLDKYFITEETARYLEFYEFNNDCVADEDDIASYPILEYTYNGEIFTFDDSTYQIIEVSENTIKWAETYTEDGETIIDTETLQRE